MNRNRRPNVFQADRDAIEDVGLSALDDYGIDDGAQHLEVVQAS